MKSFWLKKALKLVFFGSLFLVAAVFGTMSLWNWLVPTLFHGPVLGFGQTLGLLVLSRILLGGWGRGGAGRARWVRGRAIWQQQAAAGMASLSPEAREKFRQQMQSRCASGWARQTAADEAQATQTTAPTV